MSAVENHPFDPDAFVVPTDARAFGVYAINEDHGRGNVMYRRVPHDALDALFRDCLERQGVGVGADTCAGFCDLYSSTRESEADALDGWPLTPGGIAYLLSRFEPGVYLIDDDLVAEGCEA